MAHMVETMAFAGEVPWHGLGVKVPADLSPAQMLRKADLDWSVRKVPAFADVNGKKVAVGHSALVRDSDSKILDVVSDDWNILQNTEAFEFFHDFVAAGDMEMHTAGSLREGQIVWALAKVNDSFELFKGDKVDSYLLFTNPHRYGWSIDVRFTPIRVVCNNTLTLSLNSASKAMVKISHRRQFDADTVKETLGIAKEKLAKYKEMAAFLGSKRYTDLSVTDYFKSIFPVLGISELKRKEVSKGASTALKVLDTQPGASYAEGTWWQAFNAVTYMLDHLQGRSVDTRLTSAWFGQGKLIKNKALAKAVEFAEAA
jgi:phage/plasmid-like protein (TIGR03299 family)